MPDDRAPLEPAFVGAGRHLLVEGLLAAFDQVNRTNLPVWVALEAPSGWGKTRVAREFYARLAVDRQHEPAYWPPTILGSQTDLGDDVSARRKRVHPQVQHVPGSLPAFLWWGVAAAVRNGIPSFALAEDVSQLEAHAPYLDDAWARLATWSQRHGDWWRRPLAEVGKETITEVAGQVIETFAGFAVPGIGLVGSMLGASTPPGSRRATAGTVSTARTRSPRRASTSSTRPRPCSPASPARAFRWWCSSRTSMPPMTCSPSCWAG